MPNQNGRAYALTALSPIRAGATPEGSYASVTRARLEALPLNAQSPLARVAGTYVARFYVLDDVFYQGSPAKEEHLKSSYLVFSASFHGGLDPFLVDLWDCAREHTQKIWEYCVGFERVQNASEFATYLKRCQVETTFFFNGSNDDSLEEQLKALYLKQELSRFVFEQQRIGSEGAQLQRAFAEFVERTRPWQLEPRWIPGSASGRSSEAAAQGSAK